MFSKIKGLFKKDKKVKNQEEINYNIEIRKKDEELKDDIDKQIKEFMSKKEMPLFNNIEIETVNRCNGTCSFCPVNKNVDPREPKKMSEEMFKKIVQELKEINYTDAIALHSNNEPLIDKRIIEFTEYIKTELPDIFLYFFTNGTMLTLDKFKKLMKYLDLLVIDNYSDDLELIEPVEEVYNYCQEHPELKKKVMITKRLKTQILTSRGGQSNNRDEIINIKSSCLLPFNKIVIQPDGIIPLCCCDPFGKEILGNLNENSLVEIWYGKKHMDIVKKLSEGDNPRRKIELCKNCDALVDQMYASPYTEEDVLNRWKILEN